MGNAASWHYSARDRTAFALKGVGIMEQLHFVTEAAPCGNCSVKVRFDTGETGIFNCEYLTTDPYWARLKDVDFFNTARAEYGTIVWDDNIDVAPESVWERSNILP